MYPTKMRVQLFEPSSKKWWTLFGIQGDSYQLARELTRNELIALNGNDLPENVIKRVSRSRLAQEFKLTRADLESIAKFIS